MDAAALLGLQPLPALERGPEDLLALGIVLDALHRRAAEQEVRAGARHDALGKAVENPDRVLEPVPPAQGKHDRLHPQTRRRTLADDLRGADPSCRDDLGADDAHAQCKLGGALPRERGVLGPHGVDCGCHAVRIAVQFGGHEARAREHQGIGALQTRQQHLPRPMHARVGAVGADVTAPDNGRAGLLQRPDQGGGLRVLEHDDVAPRHATGQRVGMPAADAIEDGDLRASQPAAIPAAAVHPVVQPFGYPEELGRALNDLPADVDATPAPVGKKRAQQLGDSSAGGGRADRPDASAGEQAARRTGAAAELSVGIGGQEGP